MTGEGEAERALRAYYAGRIAERGERRVADIDVALSAATGAAERAEREESALAARRERARRDGRLSMAFAAASFVAMAALGLARLGDGSEARYGDGLAAIMKIETERSAFADAIGAINASWPRKD